MNLTKRVFYISNLYPNPIYPNIASFNRQQINALRKYCEVEVVAPIPWTALSKNKLTQRCRVENGVIIHHPTYYYIPYVMRMFYGEFFYYSIKHLSSSLLTKNKFDLIYSSWLYPDSWAAAKLAKKFNIPLFVKVHGSDVNRLKPGNSITRSSLEVALQAKKLLCVSKALKIKLVHFGVPEFKLEVLYNGVDRSIFHPMKLQDVRRQLNIDSDVFLVLYVGNLKKEKGIYELITSFKAVSGSIDKQSRLVIIGSGTYGATAKQLVSSLNMTDIVQFLGSQPLETIALWMNAASLLCLPSYMEGVPNVVLEALMCGTTVIATAVGGIPELDSGESPMILVPPQNIDALTSALKIGMSQPNVDVMPSFLSSWNENAKNLKNIFFPQ